MADPMLSEDQLDTLYKWIDEVPLSRPKKNISRDFSDAVMMAELIGYYFPKIIEIHNYPATNSLKSKLDNWRTLNAKVLPKLGINLRAQDCERLAASTPMVIEGLLNEFRKLCVEEDKARLIQRTNYDNGDHAAGYSRAQNTGEASNVDQNKSHRRKDQQELRITKVEELREILKLLREKIAYVERSNQRKEAEIKELQDIIQLGI